MDIIKFNNKSYKIHKKDAALRRNERTELIRNVWSWTKFTLNKLNLLRHIWRKDMQQKTEYCQLNSSYLQQHVFVDSGHLYSGHGYGATRGQGSKYTHTPTGQSQRPRPGSILVKEKFVVHIKLFQTNSNINQLQESSCNCWT